MKLERILTVGMLCSLSAVVSACNDESVDDERTLATLSGSELGELCDELEESWPDAERQVQCDDGSSVSFARSPAASCDQPELSQCPATAGDVRACAQAFVDDPCSASLELPPACAALQQTGCAAGATPALATQCPALAAPELAPFEGIYELVNHSGNGTCDAEGTSLLVEDGERFVLIVAAELFGAPIGSLQSCTDIAGCRATAAQIREQASDTRFEPVESSASVPELNQAIVCKAESAGALLSQQLSIGSASEGTCALSQTDTTLARAADGTLRLESRTFAWEKPADADACSYVAGEKPATAPCSALEVREARFVATL